MYHYIYLITSHIFTDVDIGHHIWWFPKMGDPKKP